LGFLVLQALQGIRELQAHQVSKDNQELQGSLGLQVHLDPLVEEVLLEL